MWSLRSAFLHSCRFPFEVRLLLQPGNHPDIDSAKMSSPCLQKLENYVSGDEFSRIKHNPTLAGLSTYTL